MDADAERYWVWRWYARGLQGLVNHLHELAGAGARAPPEILDMIRGEIDRLQSLIEKHKG